MTENLVQINSSWDICQTNSLGADFDALVNVQVMVNPKTDTVDASSFLDVVDMDHYLFLQSPEETDERCLIALTATKGTLKSVDLVTDARNVEIFIADTGQMTSYWKTFKGKVIEELSELGNDTYLHEICFDCIVRHVELKLGKSSDTNIYLFGLKVTIKPGNSDSSQKLVPFLPSTGSIDFKNVENILSSSNVPISAGAEKALKFLKQSGGAFGQKQSPPNMEMLMNMINQTTLNTKVPSLEGISTKKKAENELPSTSVGPLETVVKSYLDVRLKEMEKSIAKEFDDKLKAFEERQNQKFDQILRILKK